MKLHDRRGQKVLLEDMDSVLRADQRPTLNDSSTITPAIYTQFLNCTVLHGLGAGLTMRLGIFVTKPTMVILPGFLAVMGVPAVFLGLIEGVADAVSSFTKMAGGFHRR